MMRGLYIGRFQPFHNGHKAAVEYISSEVDELIIGIGSSQLSHEQMHPFTAGERVLMITRALSHLKIPLYVLPIPDVHRNAIWVSHVLSMVPQFDVVYSSNPLVIRLFREAGIEVRSPPMYKRSTLSGTHIRELMVQGGNWEEYVPKETADVIKSVNGVLRLLDISKNDE
ncbi:MAG TPA: nicotinamide-nucleotide adenylyltransferase [Methanocorpusculum sp.]|nr:nicotinamide-nucleotide adenylyltransferase [Methanocorpusculum sp.]HJJ39417.1 nicotinamide-nucleotide adenylyltransferase [Methanocorpusculum sp.]